MSNHVHCILSSGIGRLSDIVGELKGFTSKEMLKMVENGTESRKEWMLHQFNIMPTDIREMKNTNSGRTKITQKNYFL